MSKLREPVPRHAILGVLLGICFVALSAAIDPRLLRPLDYAQLVVAILVSGWVLRHADTLVHELGHAAATIWLTKRPTQVIVGRPPRTRIRVGRLVLDLGAFPYNPPARNGSCRSNKSGVAWRKVGLIALAGPIANLLEVLALIALAPLIWGIADAIRYVLVIWVLRLIASIIANLRATPPRSRVPVKGLKGTHDGWLARQAFARQREGASLPGARPAAVASPAAQNSTMPDRAATYTQPACPPSKTRPAMTPPRSSHES